MSGNELSVYMIFFFLLLLIFFWFGVGSSKREKRMSSNIKSCRNCVFCKIDREADPHDESTWNFAMCHHEESRITDDSGIGWHLGREHLEQTENYRSCSRMRRTICGRSARYYRYHEHADLFPQKIYYKIREFLRL